MQKRVFRRVPGNTYYCCRGIIVRLVGEESWIGHGATTLVGGIIGWFAGEKITETVYDYVTQPGEKPGMK